MLVPKEKGLSPVTEDVKSIVSPEQAPSFVKVKEIEGGSVTVITISSFTSSIVPLPSSTLINLYVKVPEVVNSVDKVTEFSSFMVEISSSEPPFII